MKGIRNIYRRLATLLCVALAGMNSVCWGQVYGDRYQSVGSSSFRPDYVDCSSYGSDWSMWGTTYHYGNYAVDNNKDSYWESDEERNGNLATITLRTNGHSFKGITILSAYNSDNNRPVSVKIETNNSGNGNWTLVKEQNLSRNDREITINLDAPVNAEYVRLSFERYSERQGYYVNYYEIQIYDITFQGESNIPSIQHKPAKWHEKRRGNNYVDDFDDKKMFTAEDYDASYGLRWPTDANWRGIQATHTSIETVYVEKGKKTTLILPEYRSDNGTTNIGSYQRWYDFRTDGTFATGDNGNNDIVDLLTPSTNATYYRFANGYVNRPLVVYSNKLPAQMDFYFPTDATTSDYWVACDVSGYMDFTDDGTPGDFGADGVYYEPTLTHRVIFHVIGVVGTPTREVEEYEIDFPAYTYPNYSNEMVALSMDAQSYLAGTGQSALKVSIEDNTADITLISNNNKVFSENESGVNTVDISGTQRAIYFRMPNKNIEDGTRYVDNLSSNPSATIVVKAGNSDVARFKLNFRNSSRLLTQSMIAQLDDANHTFDRSVTWRNLRYRTPKNLKEGRILLTDLNFDYEVGFAEGNNDRFYPYPLAWTSNSYGFYDGSQGDAFMGGNESDFYFPEYSSYSLLRSTNGYVEADPSWAWSGGGFVKGDAPTAILENSREEESTFHLFVDASDRPGTIAQLPFRENLCSGSILYVSAWVKSARWGKTNDNAAILFTILGVEEDGTMVPVYRHQTGQIPAAYESLNNAGLVLDKLPGLSTNEWMQTYFSFTNTSQLEFDHYVLQVDNNSPSTGGGDMYIDDIRVYVARPMAKVEQLEMACTAAADDRTRMNLRIDWNRFNQRISSVGDEGNLGICFIDTLIFHNTIKEDRSNYEEALKAAVVELGESAENTRKFRLLHYYTDFTKHKDYNAILDTENPDDALLASNNDYYFLQRTIEEEGEEVQYLAVDFYGDLIPNRAYWVVMVQDPEGVDEIDLTQNDIPSSIFNGFYDDKCALVADFKVTGDAIIKVNGEIITPETEFCRGNVHNFTVDLQVPVGEKNVTVTDGIYYDWFFGTTDDPLTEYQTTQSEYGTSLEEALRVFRNIYPDVTEVDYAEVKYGDGVVDANKNIFTEGMYKLILYYLEQSVVEGGQNKPLVLHHPNLSVTLREELLHLVVCPIPTLVPPEGLGITEAEWKKANICWGYTYLELRTTGDAPTVHAGFNITRYPEEGYDPSLRIGLEQIRKASTDGNVNLVVQLRGVQSYDPDKNDPDSPNYGRYRLRKVHTLAGEEDEQYGKIYLTHSTDPDVRIPSNEPLALPIGELVSFNAYPYMAGSTQNPSEMEIQFNLNQQYLQIDGEDNVPFAFNPREGYAYTFSVYCEETVIGAGGQAGTACIGTFPITMKVVPEYLIWDGTPTDENSLIGNWNNDGNWKRVSTKERIHKPANDTYPDDNNTENGYVPMLFSKVIMPRNSRVHLYAAGYSDDKWLYENRPSTVAEPTTNIQYDLMAYDKSDTELTTERYRVALCDEIHFEPGAEMLYAEYLLYNKAWVDYELDGGRWYTLASPLQGVVAGDFYAPTSGRQETEYFQPINFVTSTYNRFNPSVYQRGWKNEATEVKLYTTDGSNYNNVAIAGNWSSLYNDVAEKYDPGTGFSLKVQDLDSDKALFRLPKADGSYSYYEKDSNTGDNSTKVNRTNAGRLKSDDIYHRTETNTSYGGSFSHGTITVPLSESANGEYYLVGNPFMAHLDMEAFFIRNTAFDGTYWLVTDGNQTVTVGTGEEGMISTADNTTVAPLQSFFVKLGENQTAPAHITFTHGMQVLGGTSDGLRSTSNVLYLTATTQDGRTSRAAVAYSGMASDDYRSGEDAELFLDSNLGDVPMVYTVAGTMATSINARPTCERVPLGVYGTRDEEVTLRFEGTEAFGGVKLYDARTGQATALRESTELRVATNDYGRYYLIGGVPTGTESIRPGNDIEIYSIRPGEIVVTTTGCPLRTVCVYGVNGALVARQSLANQSVYRLVVPGNALYMIYAEDAEGIIRNVKMRVR